jgi:superfamily II DNA or RNA helicase
MTQVTPISWVSALGLRDDGSPYIASYDNDLKAGLPWDENSTFSDLWPDTLLRWSHTHVEQGTRNILIWQRVLQYLVKRTLGLWQAGAIISEGQVKEVVQSLGQLERSSERSEDLLWFEISEIHLTLFYTRWLLALCPTGQSQEGLKYLAHHHPAILQIQCLHLHLAEPSKEQPEHFLALLTVAIATDTEHRFIHQVVGEYLQKQDHTRDLEWIFRALNTLAGCASGLATAIAKRSLFKPIPLPLKEVGHLLVHADTLAQDSTFVHVPKDWQKNGRLRRPTLQAQLTPQISPPSQNREGFMHLSFKLSDLDLSHEEVLEILNRQEQLIFLKNQWIILDARNKDPILSKLSMAARLANERGLTLSDALKILYLQPNGRPETSTSSLQIEWKIADPQWQFVKDSALLGDGQLAILAKDLRVQLRPYQLEGVSWLYNCYQRGLSCCLADDMGLGKTLQAIAFYVLSARNQTTEPSLILCPPSLIRNWTEEFARFAPSLPITSLLTGESLSVLKSMSKICGIFITSYHLLRRNIDLFSQVQWHSILLDEAQALKNPQSQISLEIRKLKRQHAIALTGTPIENSLMDLWSLFDFLLPGFLGTANQFQSLVQTNPDSVKQALSPFLKRRMKSDPAIELCLPPKTTLKRYCSLSASQCIAYDQVINKLKEALAKVGEDQRQRRSLILPVLSKLKQICIHEDVYLGKPIQTVEAKTKIDLLLQLLRDCHRRGEKCLVFTQYASQIPGLAKLIHSQVGIECLTLTGSQNQAERSKSTKLFQAQGTSICYLISLKAGGVGLTLTAATHVIHLDRWWNPAVEDQASDRAYRLGQTQPVFVHLLITQGTLEDRIDQMINNKRELSRSWLSQEDGLLEMTKMDDPSLLGILSRTQELGS